MLMLLLSPTPAHAAPSRAAASVAAAAVIGSNPYPPGCATVGSDQGSYAPGATITITAYGQPTDAGQSFTFTISLVNSAGEATVILTLTAVANSAGVAVVTLTAPQAVGTYTVSVSSITCAEFSSSFVIRKNPTVPKAGSDVLQGVVTATVVVSTGVVLWLVARRRRSRPATA